ncbi:MAG: Oligoendopeptidase F, plasmid [Chlamydiae bacterium]|nr:Oligoendopeptidase F, plasmid [Chlamydiota bacterium]
MTRWNIQSIFPSDKAFQEEIDRVHAFLESKGDTQQAILDLQEAGKGICELDSFVSCLIAENPSNQEAHGKNASVTELQAAYKGALFHLGMRLLDLKDKDLQKLMENPEIEQISFFLTELLDIAKKKASPEKEELINILSVDGYHSYWTLYQSITNKMKIGPDALSIGQAQNLLSDSDREVRSRTFQRWSEAFQGQSDLLAQILNHIGGFRLNVYKQRGWDDPLLEPLFLNRMERKTLDAMWDAVDEFKPYFVKYLQKKAEIMGVDKLCWYDLEAPLSSSPEIPFAKAVEMILTVLNDFNPKIGAFAKEAIDREWIEAEDRPGKAAGGFCVSFPNSRESRIFMTYKGTPFNVATLAHELGHAYHNECLKDLPYFCQDARMNVAETASTFLETLIVDQSIRKAKSDEERRELLDDKLQRCVAYFLNLQARYLFETRFYEERKKGFVSAKRLCDLMEGAQREAFSDALAEWDPTFWASKLHFFFTDFPFYNFPYTFGYLLSNGLYVRAKQGGFGEKWEEFLFDTGRMRVEDLAKKHLGVDLSEPDFWRESLTPLKEDVETFLKL